MNRASARSVMCRLLLATWAVALVVTAHAASSDQREQNERITLYYGFVPAALAAAAVAPHAAPVGAARPAGIPPDTHHLVIALFDTRSGERITEAIVSVRHVSPRGDTVTKVLTSMPLGAAPSFGNTFMISEGRGHRFQIEVRRGAEVDRFVVSYDNLHGDL